LQYKPTTMDGNDLPEGFQQLGKIGEGTFGVVLRAKRIDTGEVVALKKVRLRRLEDGIPKMVMREIQTLQHLQHPNVMRLHEVIPHGSALILVCDLMRIDLAEAMRALNRPLTQPEMKVILGGVLRGVEHCHSNYILHRDLKPGNVLLSSSGEAVLGDFGLARMMETDGRPYSNQCATRWYRSPELLYGARHYGPGIDIWAVGCIFGELINHTPLFPGDNDIDQLSRIIRTLGSISTEEWLEATELPDFGKISFCDTIATPLEQVVPGATQAAALLLARMLTYNPTHRLTAREALLDDFFFSPPLAPLDGVASSLLCDIELAQAAAPPNNYREEIANFKFDGPVQIAWHRT